MIPWLFFILMLFLFSSIYQMGRLCLWLWLTSSFVYAYRRRKSFVLQKMPVLYHFLFVKQGYQTMHRYCLGWSELTGIKKVVTYKPVNTTTYLIRYLKLIKIWTFSYMWRSKSKSVHIHYATESGHTPMEIDSTVGRFWKCIKK